MEKMGGEIIKIYYSSDIYGARKEAEKISMDIGFNRRETEEILIVVNELGSNLLKYAPGGHLMFRPVQENGRVGMEIEAADTGPGINNVKLAMGDGFSSTGSLGYGFGTVNRLMDTLDITSHKGDNHGTCIRSTRWLKHHTSSSGMCPLDFHVITRAYPGMALNGDAFLIKLWEEYALIAVIDGLGHGKFAHLAAVKARNYIEKHFDLSLGEIFSGTARACAGTRGVVMAIAVIDWKTEKLSLASVGNINLRVFNTREPVHAMIRRGVIGVNAPRPVVTEHPWENDCVMVLHSDGLSTRWSFKDFAGTAKKENFSAAELAKTLFKSLAKDTDDATIVVVKGKQNGR